MLDLLMDTMPERGLGIASPYRESFLRSGVLEMLECPKWGLGQLRIQRETLRRLVCGLETMQYTLMGIDEGDIDVIEMGDMADSICDAFAMEEGADIPWDAFEVVMERGLVGVPSSESLHN